jgi:hypothetical protein
MRAAAHQAIERPMPDLRELVALLAERAGVGDPVGGGNQAADDRGGEVIELIQPEEAKSPRIAVRGLFYCYSASSRRATSRG